MKSTTTLEKDDELFRCTDPENRLQQGIARSRIRGRDMGGDFHFTSSASIGATFGARENTSIALRIQHTSNGGLNSTNPGLPMIGLKFVFTLSDRDDQQHFAV